MSSVDENVEDYIVDGNGKWYHHFGKVWQFLIELNIPLLNIYPSEISVHPKIHMQMSIVAVFIHNYSVIFSVMFIIIVLYKYKLYSVFIHNCLTL